MEQSPIVHMKYKNGHQIWIRKDELHGYKYFGIWIKKLNPTEEKNNVRRK